jgi:integrase
MQTAEASKKRRRGRQEGSIYQRSRDGKWCGVVSVGGGKRKTFVRSTRELAAKAVRDAQNATDKGQAVAPSKQLLGPYLDQWLATIKDRGEYGTYVAYELRVRRHIKPHLGHLTLSGLTPDQVDHWVRKLIQSGLKPIMAGSCRMVLGMVLTRALRDGLVYRNVVTLSDPPPKGDKEPFQRHVLDVEQATHFLEAVKSETASYRLLWVLYLTTGLRRNEALALHWREVDLVADIVRVEYALERLPSGLRIKPRPKTQAGKRQWSLSRYAADLLLARMSETNPSQDDLIFSTPRGEPLAPSTVFPAFKKFLVRAGLKDMRIQDLRGTFGTLLRHSGADMKDVQQALGHANYGTTAKSYVKVLPEGARQAQERFDNLLRPESPEQKRARLQAEIDRLNAQLESVS